MSVPVRQCLLDVSLGLEQQFSAAMSWAAEMMETTLRGLRIHSQWLFSVCPCLGSLRRKAQSIINTKFLLLLSNQQSFNTFFFFF